MTDSGAGQTCDGAETMAAAGPYDKVVTGLQEALLTRTPRISSPLLIAERSNRLYFLDVADVDYIEAQGNYVHIHAGGQEYLRRDTLKRLAAELRGLGFEWVHRSILLNLRRVAFAERFGEGALAFTLSSGARLLSRTRFKLSSTSTVPAGRSRDPIPGG